MSLLTRMHLNPARRQARMLLASPQAMHSAVLAAFAPDLMDGGDERERVLWRVDRDVPHQALLYMSSSTTPDLTHLVEQAGWPTTSGWESREYSPLLARLAKGQRWAFRVTANPVRRVRGDKEPGRGKVRGHVTAAQQTAWLLERGAAAGFEVATTDEGEPCIEVRDRRVVTFPRAGATVTIAMATFDGVLVVTDPELLRHTLTTGLGRAKAYGCGLLTLAQS